MTTWGAGDYPLMARHLETAAGAAVEIAAVGSGDRVLDVATGTGNAALLAAEEGGQVVGADFEPALLEVAEQRATDSGLQVRWLTGDLASLPAPDESADVVLSVFGVMYAADQAAAAAPRTGSRRRLWRSGGVGAVDSGQRDAGDGTGSGSLPATAFAEQRAAEPVGRPKRAR